MRGSKVCVEHINFTILVTVTHINKIMHIKNRLPFKKYRKNEEKPKLKAKTGLHYHPGDSTRKINVCSKENYIPPCMVVMVLCWCIWWGVRASEELYYLREAPRHGRSESSAHTALPTLLLDHIQKEAFLQRKSTTLITFSITKSQMDSSKQPCESQMKISANKMITLWHWRMGGRWHIVKKMWYSEAP